MTVLVLTAPEDDTATRVCRAPKQRGHDHVRMDLGDFPAKLSFTASGPGPAWAGRLSDGQHDLALSDIDAVYWRRPTSFRLPDHLDEQQQRFAVTEARQGLGGLLSCLPVPFINHPARLVAVGPECFAVAIHAGSDKSYVDWRADYPSFSYEVVETPAHIAESVVSYLKRFGLAFGCFDFTVSADTEEWVFLECGANAQWGWLEHETGLPIAHAIARQLTGDPI